MRHERPTNKSQGVSEVLAWVNRSRKLEDKRYAEKERALQLSKIFEEQVSKSCLSHFLQYVGSRFSDLSN